MKSNVAIPILLFLMLGLFQGCGSGGTLPPSLGLPKTGAAATAYVTQVAAGVGSGTILQLPVMTSGITSPVSVLDPPTTLVVLEGVAVDSYGQILASGRTLTSNSTIYSYAPASTGSAIPAKQLSIASGANPNTMIFDTNRNLYVGADNEIDVFAPNSALPFRVITGVLTRLTEINGIAINSTGEVFVTNGLVGVGSVLVFSATANGNVAPVRTISGVANSSFYDPSGITIDSQDNLYVAAYLAQPAMPGEPATIFQFASGVHDFATPLKTISGSATGLHGIGSLQIDGAGNLFVLNLTPVTTQSGTKYQPSLLVYGPSATGNATPLRTITSAAWTSSGSGQLGLY